MMRSWAFVLLLCSTCVAGCSALPSSGPSTDAVVKPVDANTPLPYPVVNVDQGVLDVLHSVRGPRLSDALHVSRRSNERVIGVGDSLAITVWEGGDGGLFSQGTAGALATGSRSTAIQNAVVDRTGEITFPYLGRVKVAGQSTRAIEDKLREALKDKSIQPQVSVNVTTNVYNTVNVLGDVAAGGRKQLTQRNDRLADLIAEAGGTRFPPFDEIVQITRGSRSGGIRLSRVLRDPADNISVMPGDTILVQHSPLSFVMLGATSRIAQVPFEIEQLTLAEALGKAGGPIDQRADASAVFIFRARENGDTVRTLTAAPKAEAGPIVYRIDLKTGSGLLYAQNFAVRDKDILYVSNSELYEALKFFTLLRGVSGVVGDISRPASVFY